MITPMVIEVATICTKMVLIDESFSIYQIDDVALPLSISFWIPFWTLSVLTGKDPQQAGKISSQLSKCNYKKSIKLRKLWKLLLLFTFLGILL